MVVAGMYGVVVLLMSLCTFCAYGLDKRQARLDQRRISEKKLQLFGLLGGWPGAIIGQRYFRHKTQKTSFQIVFWAMVALHVGVVAASGYLYFKIA